MPKTHADSGTIHPYHHLHNLHETAIATLLTNAGCFLKIVVLEVFIGSSTKLITNKRD